QLAAFRGPKILAVQDEYDQTDKLRAAIKPLGFTTILTCVPQESAEVVYPRDCIGDAELVTVLTGYVPEGIPEGRKAVPLSERPVSIGYRGRVLGGQYGRLGFEKFEIGRAMRRVCEERGIAHDIEWADDKRIYGPDWYAFLGSCRAVLGSESGCNVFDFDGSI